MSNYGVDYKLDSLKRIRNFLALEDKIVAYGESCNPDPYGQKRNCKWSYMTLDVNMREYPCPWDMRLLNKSRSKKEYSRYGCFYKCLLRSRGITEDYILKNKDAYVGVMDKLIDIMSNDTNWRKTLSEGSLLSKQGRSIISNSNKEIKEESKLNHKLKIESKKSISKEELSKMADEITEYVKKSDISVIRYNSKGSNSIYLKFDYGMAGTLRLSDHHTDKDLNYTFNVLSCISSPCKKSVTTQNGYACDQYYYPAYMYTNAAMDIVRFREFRRNKYGKSRYDALVIQYKDDESVKKGFWQRAEEQ